MITSPRKHSTPGTFWALHREATLNWLALGTLLAAWNTVGYEREVGAPRRPDALRGYSHVSVRAANRVGATLQSRDSS